MLSLEQAALITNSTKNSTSYTRYRVWAQPNALVMKHTAPCSRWDGFTHVWSVKSLENSRAHPKTYTRHMHTNLWSGNSVNNSTSYSPYRVWAPSNALVMKHTTLCSRWDSFTRVWSVKSLENSRAHLNAWASRICTSPSASAGTGSFQKLVDVHSFAVALCLAVTHQDCICVYSCRYKCYS